MTAATMQRTLASVRPMIERAGASPRLPPSPASADASTSMQQLLVWLDALIRMASANAPTAEP
jgi:hypothetical protein